MQKNKVCSNEKKRRQKSYKPVNTQNTQNLVLQNQILDSIYGSIPLKRPCNKTFFFCQSILTCGTIAKRNWFDNKTKSLQKTNANYNYQIKSKRLHGSSIGDSQFQFQAEHCLKIERKGQLSIESKILLRVSTGQFARVRGEHNGNARGC